jgi:hypothetical protein
LLPFSVAKPSAFANRKSFVYLAVLAIREQQIEDGIGYKKYSVFHAYQEHPFIGSEQIETAIEILDSEQLSRRDYRSLMQTLANQIA